MADIKVSRAIAYLESNDDAIELLEAVGFSNAVPQEGSAGYINFTDQHGAGYAVRYRIFDEPYGVCTITNIDVEREPLYDQIPINQHDLLMFILELEKDNTIETKNQMANKLIEFMRRYK